MRKTPLHAMHQRLGARMIDYAGWEMPLRYTSEIEEHHSVRRDAGMFDVSHMSRIDLSGRHSAAFLRHLLANDIFKLKLPGRALYSCMLNEQGGIIDDLVVYYLEEDRFRLVANAATLAKDLAWIERHAQGYDITCRVREDLAMIAVQGPHARSLTDPLLPRELGRQAQGLSSFAFCHWRQWLVAATGYTGERGYELMMPGELAPQLWESLCQAGAKPCGLAARDTLRLEAGLNLYGQDMDESVTPLECGLAWTVALDPPERQFIGRAALEEQKRQGVRHRRAGIILLEPGMLRKGQRIQVGGGEGFVTSGGFSPMLQRSIALARLPVGSDATGKVEIRGRWKKVQIVEPPFVRQGQIRVEILTDQGG